jgi:hypothetical protein
MRRISRRQYGVMIGLLLCLVLILLLAPVLLLPDYAASQLQRREQLAASKATEGGLADIVQLAASVAWGETADSGQQSGACAAADNG